MSIDPRLERSVLAELAFRERRARRQPSSLEAPRGLAERLHHASEGDVLPHALSAAALLLLTDPQSAR